MLYRLIKYLTDPYVFLMLVLGIALALLWRRIRSERRPSLRLAIAAYLGLFVVSMPVVTYIPIRLFESQYPYLDEPPRDAQAIVILGGGIRPGDAVRKRTELVSLVVLRCLYAADLDKEIGPLPIYVTGGKVDPSAPGPSEAEPMRDFLIRIGIKPENVFIEPGSTSTFENAEMTCEMLRKKGIHRILIITEAMHMPRADGCFRKQGMDVVPAISTVRAGEFRLSLGMFLPSIYGLSGACDLTNELVGYSWYKLTGKL